MVEANNQGVPFVLADPAARISADMAMIAAGIRTLGALAEPVAAVRRR